MLSTAAMKHSRLLGTLLFGSALALTGCKTISQAGGVRIVGNQVELDDHVNFKGWKATILDESHPLLDRVAFVLKARSDISVVHIHGHTDKTGDADQNMALSTQRAESVVEYLRGRDVKADLQPKGYGQSAPICEETSTDCNAKNRRVEFQLEWKKS